jgi:hypothetical protein
MNLIRSLLTPILIGLAAPFVLSAAPVTFYQDILPIFEKHCLQCHRTEGIGPMRLDTYATARPYAKAIEQAVASRIMPPWFADRAHGSFANERRLLDFEIDQIRRWVATGAEAGRTRFARLPTTSFWDIGEPDQIIDLPQAVQIPAKGQLEYQYIVLPQKFARETWVRAVEIRPGISSVVHHAVLYVREPGSTWTHGPTTSDILAVYTPGNTYDVFPRGMAKRIPAGADLLLQVHYTPDGDAHRDRTRIGLQFSKDNAPPTLQILTLQLNKTDFTIPAGDPNYRVSVSGTVPRDATLISLFPHMHLRGKAFEYAITGDGGQYETLLKVPRYDFHWQLNYKLRTPRLLKAGTRLEATAWYDNSANNKRNPDPKAEVGYGEQSWDEMMVGFFDVAVDPAIDKATFFQR